MGRTSNRFTLVASAILAVAVAACATSDATVTGVNQQGDSLALSAVFDSSFARVDTSIVAGDTIVRVEWVDTIFAPGDTMVITRIDTIFAPGDTVVVNASDTVVTTDTVVTNTVDTVYGPDGPQLVTSVDTVVVMDTVIVNSVDTLVTVDTVLVNWGRDTVVAVDTVTFETTDTIIRYDTVLVRDTVSPEIELDRGALALRVGQTVQLQGKVLDGSGSPIDGASISWLSEDPGVARVRSDGRVTGVAVGATEVFAVAEGVSQSLRVTVSEESDIVSRIVLSPSSFGLGKGESRQMSARALNSDGAPVADAVIEWSSSNPGVASVSSSGRVKGVSGGVAKITATNEGVTATATVQVTEPLATTDDLIFYDSFESGGLGHKENGVWWRVGKRASVASGVSTRGSRALRLTYVANAPQKDGWAEQPMGLPDLGEIYLEYDLLVPRNFRVRYDGGPVNNKFARFWQGRKADGIFSVTWEYSRSSDSDFAANSRNLSQDADDRDPADRSTLRARPLISRDGPIVPGEWVTIGLAVKPASGRGKTDGYARLYVDGVKVAAGEDRELWNTAGYPLTVLNGLYLMGWANSGFAEQTVFHIDNLKVYGRIPDGR